MRSELALIAALATMAVFALAIVLGSERPEKLPEEESQTVSVPDTLTDWQLLQMAIIMTESRFDTMAHGSHDDAGLYQMIPIYVAEVNRLTGAMYHHSDAYDMDKAMEMFDLYQSFKNPEHDRDLAIYHHNKASWYRSKVLENLEFVGRYETVRRKLIER